MDLLGKRSLLRKGCPKGQERLHVRHNYPPNRLVTVVCAQLYYIYFIKTVNARSKVTNNPLPMELVLSSSAASLVAYFVNIFFIKN